MPIRAANRMITVISLVGILGPMIALKYGNAKFAVVLNIGRIKRNPIKGAASTTAAKAQGNASAT